MRACLGLDRRVGGVRRGNGLSRELTKFGPITGGGLSKFDPITGQQQLKFGPNHRTGQAARDTHVLGIYPVDRN
jgi:hypothetical protein